jgi:hypothetical protein
MVVPNVGLPVLGNGPCFFWQIVYFLGTGILMNTFSRAVNFNSQLAKDRLEPSEYAGYKNRREE